MAKADRIKNRMQGRASKQARAFQRSYYLIFTDTQATERCYFEGMRQALQDDKLCIQVFDRIHTHDLVQRAESQAVYYPQFSEKWIVLDRDEVKDFDALVEQAHHRDLEVAWSNPCFEIWFFAYFGNMPTIEESTKCCQEFGRLYKKWVGREYKKSGSDIYQILTEKGDETKAIEVARQKYHQLRQDACCRPVPSKLCPATTVFQLVERILGK